MKNIHILPLLLFLLMLAVSPAWAQTSAPETSEPTAPPAISEADQASEAVVVLSDLSAPGSIEPRPADPDSSSFLKLSGGNFDLLKGLGAFILVLFVLIMTLKGLGRMGRFKGSRRGRANFFELRGIQALDSRKYLAAVEANGRIIIVGVTQDRITPVAQWVADSEDEEMDLKAAKLPTDEPGLKFMLPEEDENGLNFKLYEEDEEFPIDICVADHHPERSSK